jgi:hypothetical protein
MGAEGDKARKPRRSLARVSKYQDSNYVPLAGLVGTSDVASGAGKGQGPPREHRPVGKVGSFILWCMGRRPRDRSSSGDHTVE